MAVAHRQPAPGVIFHSDRGCQDTSMAFGTALRESGLVRSVGRPATCWDSIVAESFFATFKKELIYRHTWPHHGEAQHAIFKYIELFYNRRRRHSTLGYLSPSVFEAQYARVA
jgi:transposase InsO family protein